MRVLGLICALALSVLLPTVALAAPVLMISIDGLRPADVLQADERGLKLPSLRRLVADGTYATGVRNSLPTLTYPNHVTLITGVWPARHGIAGNNPFDPEGKNLGGWYWYAEDIKVPTLWDAAHGGGLSVANLFWPVATGSRSIDWNVPEYWRARLPEDLKLLRALATPGLVPALERDTSLKVAAVFSEEPEGDEARAAWAGALMAEKHPSLFTLHLVSLDHAQHDFGPGSPEANRVLERIDAALGRLIDQTRAAEPGLVVAVVSDHGFAPLHTQTNLVSAFADAGLITLDPKSHKVKGWEAFPWGGASAQVILARPDDPELKARVKAVLDRLAADPALGIERVIGADEIARMGGTPATFWIDFKIGWEAGGDPGGPATRPSTRKGMRGYFPDHPEMRATFIIVGPGIAHGRSLGEIDQRDIAPTVAKVLRVEMPSADGHSLF
jgi:predicted AlkP superfamily pyrophosphatase or phosphodiesterase